MISGTNNKDHFLPRYREKDRFLKKCSRKASSDPRRPFLIPEMETTGKID